jgi:hypothetical protein
MGSLRAARRGEARSETASSGRRQGSGLPVVTACWYLTWIHSASQQGWCNKLDLSESVPALINPKEPSSSSRRGIPGQLNRPRRVYQRCRNGCHRDCPVLLCTSGKIVVYAAGTVARKSSQPCQPSNVLLNLLGESDSPISLGDSGKDSKLALFDFAAICSPASFEAWPAPLNSPCIFQLCLIYPKRMPYKVPRKLKVSKARCRRICRQRSSSERSYCTLYLCPQRHKQPDLQARVCCKLTINPSSLPLTLTPHCVLCRLLLSRPPIQIA